MNQPIIHSSLNNYQFPKHKTLCDEKPFSRELLYSLLEQVYSASPAFTGYLNFLDADGALFFLFFFNGTPYSVGSFVDGKSVRCSVRELGWRLASSFDKGVSITLCETDPVLLKNMLLFLLEEPYIKAPVTLIDIDYVVRQIEEAGTDAMIALCRDKKINFFFFWNGKGARAHYSDLEFEQPEGMTVDEEMQLYAFQSGSKVQAYVFRNMASSVSEDLNQLDKDSLYKLLAEGPQRNRREDTETSPTPVIGGATDLVDALPQKAEQPGVILSVESGPLQGERFTVTLPCIIGRSGCDLKLDDNRISRRHAELKMVGYKLVIEDLESKNGTKVNGESVMSKQLFANDLISIGPINLKITAG